MNKLEDLQPNAAVRGILPDALVTVVSVQWFGSEALELTYKTPAGKVAKLARARAALSVPAPDPLVVESVEAFMRRIHRIESLRCPHCGNGSFVPSAPIAPARAPRERGPP